MSNLREIFNLILGAPGRLRHSRGFGIHSPWAFAFVTDVLCLRSVAYYAYTPLHNALIASRKRYRNLPTESQLFAAFRVVNYFRPQYVVLRGDRSDLLRNAVEHVDSCIKIVDTPPSAEASVVTIFSGADCPEPVGGWDAAVSAAVSRGTVIAIGLRRNASLRHAYERAFNAATRGFSFLSPDMAVYAAPPLSIIPHQAISISL